MIDKAKEACTNAGGNISDHFPDVGKMINLAKGAQREVTNLSFKNMHAFSQAHNKRILNLRQPIYPGEILNARI